MGVYEDLAGPLRPASAPEAIRIAPVVVLDLRNFRKPMVLLQHDGDRPVPAPGVLFYANDSEGGEKYLPTVFRRPELAEQAITASVSYRQGRGYEGVTPDTYYLMDVDTWQEIVEAEQRRRKRRRKAPQHAGTPPETPED